MRLQFVNDLPPVRRARKNHVWVTRLGQLHTHPGKWARVKVYNKGASARAMAHMLKTGQLVIPAGRFEFAVRDCAIWARWVGPGKGNWGTNGAAKHRKNGSARS